jgi:hypothetical protein
MTWAQRLKRVFKLDLTSCEGCGGQVRVTTTLPGVPLAWAFWHHGLPGMG